MALLASEKLLAPLCELLGIEGEGLLALAVHLAVNEPVVGETTFYGDDSAIEKARGLVEDND